MENNMQVVRSADVIAEEINGIKAQAGAVMTSAFAFARRSVFEIGRRLEEAKAMLPHGEWGAWLSEHVAYSESTAANIMRCYREYGDEQIDMLTGVSDAEFFGSLSQSQMVELFALPKESRRAFVEEHREEMESGEMSVRELKAEIARLKAENESQAEDIRFNDETYENLLAEHKAQSEELAAMKAATAEPVVQEIVVNRPSEEQVEAMRREIEEQLRAEFDEERDAIHEEYDERIKDLESERDDAVKDAARAEELEGALEKAKALNKTTVDKLKAAHEKQLAELEESYKKQAKAAAAGSDPAVLRVQIALEVFRREVRTVAGVLMGMVSGGEEAKADKLRAQVERTLGQILTDVGWTV